MKPSVSDCNNTDRSLSKRQLENARLPYPDEVLYAGLATLGENQSLDSAHTAQREKIISAVCAILNSGGGIVLVESADKNYDYSQDGLGKDIEDALDDLIFPSTLDDYYDFMPINSYLLIFVKTWIAQNKYPKLCTLESGLYGRSLSSKKMLNAMEVLDLAQKKTSGKGKKPRLCAITSPNLRAIESLLTKPYFCQGENLQLSKLRNVEYEDFSTGDLKVRMKEIKPGFSALANSGGGYLIIGVDDKATVKGCGKYYSTSELESLVTKNLSEMKTVHFDDCNCAEDLYTLTIMPVRDLNQQDAGYVLFIKVKLLSCLVFVHDPQAWIVDTDHKKIKRLTASDWISLVMSNNSLESSLESQFENLSIEKRPPLAKSVYRKKGLETLQEQQINLFGSLDEAITIKPDNLHAELTAEHPELEGLLKTLVSPGEGGVVILSRSWAVDLDQKCNSNVVCDVLVLSSGRHPKLYSVFSGKLSQKEFDYSRHTALVLKQQLVNIGGYSGKLCIIPAALHLSSANEEVDFSWPEINYPEAYQLDNFDTVKELLSSLSFVMLSFRSFLSDKVGMEYFNLLTTEQYNVVSKQLFKGPFFIHGPPGTGKTVVALEIIKKIRNTYNCSPDKVLYICENTPLRQFVWKKKICQAVTRCTFQKKDFPHVEHIVADEAQNFQCEDGNWFKKAEDIVGGKGCFYIFLDYFQACHRRNTGLPPWDQQNKHTLTKVVRSPEKIYTYMHDLMREIALKVCSPFLKEVMEKSECCHGVRGHCDSRYNFEMHRIVQYIAQTCKKYLSNGYSQGDIAILCNTEYDVKMYAPFLEEEVKRQTKKLRTRVKPFARADDNLENYIVLDSIRRFAGLERCIVFAINPICQDPYVDDNLLLCAASRATAKLHILYEP
ncbi:schlafen family member 9-like isoform X2 [Hyperolius riggenbachi]|uniref:schlafen family member 9-like isoform X2 n=1 Tax=Hyperolius riggenbachi TaxID=752182 RepID=UPI0035A3BFB4